MTEFCNDKRTLFESPNLKEHLTYIAVVTYLFVCADCALYLLL